MFFASIAFTIIDRSARWAVHLGAAGTCAVTFENIFCAVDCGLPSTIHPQSEGRKHRAEFGFRRIGSS